MTWQHTPHIATVCKQNAITQSDKVDRVISTNYSAKPDMHCCRYQKTHIAVHRNINLESFRQETISMEMIIAVGENCFQLYIGPMCG